MNIKDLNKNIESDVMFDSRNNEVRVGDIVYAGGKYEIVVGIVRKLCRSGFQVLNHGLYSPSNVIKATNVITKEETDNLKNKLKKYEEEKADPTSLRLVCFVYKNKKNKEVGCGKVILLNRKSLLLDSLNYFIDQEKDTYDFYFLKKEAMKKDGLTDFYIETPNKISNRIKFFPTDEYLNRDEKYKMILFQFLDKETAEEEMKIIGNDKRPFMLFKLDNAKSSKMWNKYDLYSKMYDDMGIYLCKKNNYILYAMKDEHWKKRKKTYPSSIIENMRLIFDDVFYNDDSTSKFNLLMSVTINRFKNLFDDVISLIKKI